MSARDRRIRLGMVVAKNVGPVKAREARDRFRGWVGAEQAAGAGEEMPAPVRTGLRHAAERGERILHECSRRGIRILFRRDPGWPGRIECLTDAPEVLFLRGRTDVLEERGVGIVGSRVCSRDGAEMTVSIAARLAEEGWSVISGLARGIDAGAHRGALSVEGDTVAVLGCSPDFAYPPENAELQERIADRGLLVSEFAPGAPAVPGNFPRRNRTLAALSEAVLVVESRLRSGALVTARHALDQGKDLYVVPGSPRAALSAGPLQLLRHGARPVRGAEDLLEDLGGIPGRAAADPEELDALRAIRSGAATVPELAASLGIGADQARDRLARLELLGLLAPERVVE